MLGAIKRRWKPKSRSSVAKDNNDENLQKKNINNNKNVDIARITPLDTKTTLRGKIHLPDEDADVSSQSPPSSPTRNICVQHGRIEFIRSPSDGGSVANNRNRPEFKRSPSEGSSCYSANTSIRSGRGFYTTSGSLSSYAEKTDLAKEALEARVRELERLLETEQQSGERERLAVGRLQQQLAKRDAAHRDVERERRRRVDTETKCREAAVETQRYRNSLAKLQKEFNRMEESLRSMVHLRSKCDVLVQEKASLTAAYETRIQTYQNTIGKLGQENQQLRNHLRLLRGLDENDDFMYTTISDMDIHDRCFERLRALEEENTNLSQESETAKRQYERCLDDIANQVVRALLSQKGLREEISNLQRRIKDLESQNQALANLLVRRLSTNDDESWFGIFSPSPLEPEAVMGLPSRLHSLDSLLMLPLQRPRSLHLIARNTNHKRVLVNKSKPIEDEGNESPESGNRDEGYSTMSSDVQVLVGETSEVSRLGLEDLKEATDEAEEEIQHLSTCNRQSRNVMRSYSDSHLCLRNGLRHSRRLSLLLDDTGSSWWDHLRFDDQQMDRSELENWSLSFEDVGILPSIREIDANWSSNGSLCDASLQSEETSEPSANIGTNFTRDFYRLVQFESTRSLESSSSSRAEACGSHDRELALQSVLHFIAEQQKYCHTREEEEEELPQDCYRNEKDCTDQDKLQRTENFSKCLQTDNEEIDEDLTKDVVDSIASSISTPDTIVGAARIASPLKIKPDTVSKTKIPVISLTRKPNQLTKNVSRDRISSRKSSGIPIPCKPDRLVIVNQSTIGFNERASSKDVIDELNRMIRKGEDVADGSGTADEALDEEFAHQPTGWVHVEREIDFTDPKARANLLDVMLASSASSDDDSVDYTHLHRLHRLRRQKLGGGEANSTDLVSFSDSFSSDDVH